MPWHTLFIALLLVSSGVTAQSIARNPKTGDSYTLKQWIHVLPDTFDLFDDTTPLKIRLVADFKDIVNNRFHDEYRDASLYYLLNDTLEIHKEIGIKPRGNFRRNNCAFPPLHLNFKKSTFHVPQIQSFEKMKMVTECVNEERFQVYLLREYLIYRIYNQLTPLSFHVRLLHITYEDVNDTEYNHSGFAFILEDIDDLAHRNNGMEIDSATFSQPELSSRDMLVLVMFEYMIGNQDWSVAGFKNIKVIKNDQGIRAIPYDFDYSGFVNTYYARPKRHLGLNSIRDRYYMGICHEREEVVEVLDLFLGKKKEIYQLLSTFSYLQIEYRNDLISYLDQFYDQISTPDAWMFFMKTCR